MFKESLKNTRLKLFLWVKFSETGTLTYILTMSLRKYLIVFLVLFNSIQTTADPKTHIIRDKYIKNNQ